MSATTWSWPDALRRLRRRLAIAYTLCPIAMAAAVAIGHDHRLPAAITLWAIFFATHTYVLLTCTWTFLIHPLKLRQEPS